MPREPNGVNATYFPWLRSTPLEVAQKELATLRAHTAASHCSRLCEQPIHQPLVPAGEMEARRLSHRSRSLR